MSQEKSHKGVIAWFVHNPVAANILMVSIILFGLYAVIKKIPLEVFPEFSQNVVNITIPYSGATPAEVEQGIILRVEDAIGDLQGIEKIYGNALEGSALIRADIRDGYDTTKVLNEIKSRIDGISNFPEDAERATVEELIRVRDVISVIVTMDGDNEVQLRRITEQVRDEIRALPKVTQVAMGGIRPWELSIDIPKIVLEQYNLTLDQVASAIRNASRDIPGGTIKTSSGDILVRALGQAYRKKDFANISILSQNNGTRIRLGDIATITDGFNADPLYTRFDNQQAAFITISRIGNQNAIEIADAVKSYIDQRIDTLPAGVNLSYWKDDSKIVKARLGTLIDSATIGIGLVVLLLTLFLRPAVALWVSLGIPISMLGALAVMPELGVTLNIVSMFAFILVLGIVVDDAIVTGENVYTHIRRDNDPLRAAIEGTQEISVPVTFGVLTTVAAFLPLLLLEGNRAPIFAQIPMIVIPVLLFSLIESKFVLPSHLRHVKNRKRESMGGLAIVQQWIAHGLESYIHHIHRPFLNIVLNWRYVTVASFIFLLIVSIGLMTSGRYKYTFFPRIESETVVATLKMPEGTSVDITIQHISRMNRAAEKLQKKYVEPNGDPVIKHILMKIGTSGSRPRSNATGQAHVGSVSFEVIAPELRLTPISTRKLVSEWQRMIGDIAGAQELSFRAEIGRGGEPIDLQIAGNNYQDLNEVANQIKTKLTEFDGLFDIQSSFESGKTEVQLRIKPEGEQLGLTMQELGTQVRHAVYGAEAQRIQRDQSEVKVMVRYPEEERLSLAELKNLKIRTRNGVNVPLLEVADLSIGQGTATITRVDRQRTINVTADLDKQKTDATAIMNSMREWLPELLKEYPSVSYDLEGEQKEQKEFGQSLGIGFGIALLCIYVLLAIPLQSYTQPLMVMTVIPFSLIGALIGHMVMDISLSISSFLGLLALVGVVVNDSLVLVDYINRRMREGMPVAQAVRMAGAARFRPILLTSLTTFAGLTPLILEKSTQAQFLIPMAVSLGFGILFATFLTLILLPAWYLILEDIRQMIANTKLIILRLLGQVAVSTKQE